MGASTHRCYIAGVLLPLLLLLLCAKPNPCTHRSCLSAGLMLSSTMDSWSSDTTDLTPRPLLMYTCKQEDSQKHCRDVKFSLARPQQGLMYTCRKQEPHWKI
jgi:hypothetical protein